MPSAIFGTVSPTDGITKHKKNMNKKDVTREMLDTIRSMSPKVFNEQAIVYKQRNILKEEEEKESQSIPITDDPKFGQNVLSNQIDDFKQTVHGGAKFSEASDGKSPLVYFPETGNLVFSGTIPSLAGLKFQYSLNDVTGAPYIFVDGLALTEDVVTTLNKLCGHYKNWKDSWFAGTDLLEQLKKKKD